MAITPNNLQTAPTGTIWQAKSGKVTHFVRKIGDSYEVWNSEYSNTHYKVTLDQAVTYANQYNMVNANTNTKPAPKNPPVSQAQAPAPRNNSNQSDDDRKKQASDSTVPSNLRTAPKDSLQSTTRAKNPLGWLASYNYQLSLYVMDPATYDLFIQSGRRIIKNVSQLSQSNQSPVSQPGAFLIAQSGGRNIKDQPDAFKFDYGIDNVKIQTVGVKENGLSAVTYEISFDIIEPYGFSFVTNLKRANEMIKGPDNPTKQLFVMGLRFYGYDQMGNQVRGSDIPPGQNEPIDSFSSDTALFEKYFDISMNEVKATLNGKETRYAIKCTSGASMEGFGKVTGTVKSSNINLKGKTVGDWLAGLVEGLNSQSAAIAKSTKSTPYTYDIKWASDEVRTKIFEASIVSSADLDQYKWNDSGAKTTTDVNDALARENSKPKSTERTHTINKDTPILSAIDQVITQSAFMENALSILYDTSLEPNSDKNDLTSKQKKTDGNTFEWYSCQPEITELVWDKALNSWVYKTTYYIKLYKAPIIDSAYSLPRSGYYGPFKRYEYWYTGKNSEVIKYSHTIDNLFYNVALSKGVYDVENLGSSTPVAPGQKTDMSTEGRQGLGLESANAIKTYLYDPASQAQASISILGDPDYLGIPKSTTEVSPTGTNAVYNSFYQTAGTLDFGAGQVYIEIDFKEAVDYDADTPGVLDINDNIQFWNPKDSEVRTKANARGLRYLVTEVSSTFRQGKFQQDITAVLAEFQADAEAQKLKAEGQRDAQAEPSPAPAGPAPGNSASTTSSTGLTPEQSSRFDNFWKNYDPSVRYKISSQPATPTGPGGQSVQSES